jgi:hypothetical protein
MKKRLIVSVFAIALFSIIFAVTQNNTSANQKNTQKNPCVIDVYLTGNGSTNATVRARHIDSGVDYYIPQVGSTNQYRQCNYLPDGEYNIYACTNYPSYGSALNVKSDEDTTIPLTGGICPFGDD